MFDEAKKQLVRQKIDEVRPMLQRDGGDVEVVEVTDDGRVRVRLKGACAHCAMSVMTLKIGIEGYLRKTIPDIAAVESVE